MSRQQQVQMSRARLSVWVFSMAATNRVPTNMRFQVQRLQLAMQEYEADRWRVISGKVGNGFSATACKEKAMELDAPEMDDTEYVRHDSTTATNNLLLQDSTNITTAREPFTSTHHQQEA